MDCENCKCEVLEQRVDELERRVAKGGFLGIFRGPQGPRGFDGPAGPMGFMGATGPKGDCGVQGPKGDKGDSA